MNRYLTFAVALAASALVSHAADYTSGGISYNVISDFTKTVCIVESSTASGDLEIPSTVVLGGVEYSVTEIGKQAFAESKLTSVVIPESILKIGDGAFMSCTKLKTIRYNATGCTVAGTKENSAFSGCDAVTGITIGENVTLIPPYIFQGLSSLRSIAIPRNVAVIGNRAFADCTSVSEIYFDAAHCGEVSSPFDGCIYPFSMVISDNVEEVPANLCAGSGITTLTVGKNVKSLKSCSFGTRKGTLESVFYNSIDAINESYYSSPFSSGFGSDDKIKRVVLGPEVRKLPPYFMSGFGTLATVEWNEKLEEIGDCAFLKCAFVSFKAPKSLKKIGYNAMPSKLSSVELNEGLEVLSGFNSSQLQEIVIPSSVIEIGKSAFESCSKLKKVIGLDNDNIEIIGEYAFYGSGIVLDQLKLGKNLKSIGDYAFQNLKTIHKVILNEGLESVGYSAFLNTEAFVDIEFRLPESIKMVKDDAFNNCGISGKLVIPEGLELYSRKSFGYNPGVTEVVFNAINAKSDYSSRDSGPFAGLNVSSVIIGEKVQTIGAILFSKMPNLESVILPASVKTVGSYAFCYCDKLSYVSFNKELEYIGADLFYSSAAVNKISFDQRNSTKNSTWYQHSNLTKFILGENVEEFYSNFFTSSLKWVKWDAVEVSKYYSSGDATCPVIIGENVKSAVGYSFATVISNAPVPPALYKPKAGATAYVPDKAAYEENPDWNKYILKQSVTWKGTIDGDKLEYSVNFPYELTLKHYLDESGNVMDETPKEIGKYKAIFTYTLEDDEFELISPFEIKANVDNTMIIEPFRTHTGREVVIPVEMVSKQPITSFQMDLYLPEGMTLAKDEYNEYMIDLTDRKSNTHTLSTASVDGGKGIRIAAMSMRNHTFSDLEGTLLNITVRVADDAPVGDAMITLRNIRLVEPSSAAQEFYTNRKDVTISIGRFIEGDTNDDGKVTIADVVNTVNMMLGIKPDKFVFDAADLVKDGQITITDVVAVMNLTMLTESERPEIPLNDIDVYYEEDEEELTEDIPTYFESIENGYGFKVSEVRMTEGEDALMRVEMENAEEITAFQFDLTLPEGITIPEDEWGDPSVVLSKRATRTHMLVTREQPDGALRIAAYSSQNSPFRANSGDLVDVSLRAASTLPAGNYELGLSFIEMSNPAAVPFRVPDFTVTAVVGTTGIEDLYVNPVAFNAEGGKGEILITSPADREVKVYTLAGGVYTSGRVHEGMSRVAVPSGVYVVNGKKILVK